MAASLAGTRDAIVQELEEATYEFKVQYNDRPLSAESYLAESLDSFKHSFKEFSEQFGRPQVRALLKEVLDQRVMDLLAKRYWNKPVEDLSPTQPDLEPLSGLPKADSNSLYWQRKLDASTSELTKLGVGRISTTVVAAELQSQVDKLIAASTFASHPYAQRSIVDASTSILNERFYSTSDQVENCIKPFKFEIEVEPSEWNKGRENIGSVLKNELKACEGVQRQLEDVTGKRKLKDVMGFIDRVKKGDVVLEGDGGGGAGGFSSALLQKGLSICSSVFDTWLICTRSRSDLSARQSRDHQDAPAGRQVQAMRQLEEQNLLSRNLPGRRRRQIDLHSGTLPQRGTPLRVLLQLPA